MSDLREHLQTTLGNAYVLDRELGGGGMSRVFVADDVGLHRRLVVKVLPAELAADVSLARFEREIALAARLQHPHIVPLLSAGETNGLPYYTMPFIEGESLRQRLTRGELPVAEAVRLTREIASALAYAHDHGVVHRDVKPENVLLSGGVALVADFGVAKAVSDAAAARGITGTGIAVGTPAYMSPEQVSADPGVDHRSDIYALGLIAYEMLAGQSPFAGRTAQALLAAHVVSTPEPVQQRRASVPDGVAELVMRCLEKNPADRPQTALEIIQTLDTFTAPTPTGIRARRTPVAKRSRTIAIGLAIALVIVAPALWIARTYRAASPAAPLATRLLIAPFENLTGDPRFDHIGLIAADRLALGVTQRGSIDVVPSTTVLMTLRDTTGGTADRLKRLSDATNASLLVTGTVALRGDSLVLQAQIRDLRGGRASATLDPAVGPAANPTAAVDVLGDHLLGALGVQELAKFLPRGFRAPKFAAYQEFAGGWERFVLKGDFIGSRPYFERAIAIDSTYTLAYQLLGRQYLNSGEYARGDSIERIIERLPLGLNAVEQLNLEYAKAELRGDIAGLFRAQQQLVARDSGALALSLSGEAGVWMLRPSVAIPAFEHAHATFRVMGGWADAAHSSLMAQAYHLAGRHQLERNTLTEVRFDISDHGFIRGRLLLAYAGLGKPTEALAVADTLLRDDDQTRPTAIASVLTGAEEFRAHGDSITAAQILARARAWIAMHPRATPSSNRQLVEGMVFLESGAPDSAIARLTLAARDTSRIEAAGYLALARYARGDRAGAQSIADSLGALKRPWMFGRNTFWRAAILGALGQRERAVQLLQQAHTEGQPMEMWHSLAALQPLHGYPPFDALIRPEI